MMTDVATSHRAHTAYYRTGSSRAQHILVSLSTRRQSARRGGRNLRDGEQRQEEGSRGRSGAAGALLGGSGCAGGLGGRRSGAEEVKWAEAQGLMDSVQCS